MGYKLIVKPASVEPRYGRLTVISLGPLGPKHRLVNCVCDCGQRVSVRMDHMKSGRTTSCGCFRGEVSGSRMRTHGLNAKHARLLGILNSMRRRCEVPSCSEYRNYGGRGIAVCKEWSDPAAFVRWSTDNGYRAGLQIDRIDNDAGYSPGNCRWVTGSENMQNTSTNKRYQAFGESKTIRQWTQDARCVVGFVTLCSRVARRCKWASFEKALTTPVGASKGMSKWGINL